jgi:rod shape-determining protein MreD
MALNSMSSSAILRPAKPWFIIVSLLIAVLIKLIPVDRDLVMPDILLLVLLFWNIRQSRTVGIGISWFFGVLMDVHSSSVFGEHALAYTLLSYFAITIHRRVLWFSPWIQAVHLLPLLLAAQAVTVAVRMTVGGGFPGLMYFSESLMTAALWPIVQFILLAPQQMPENRDNDRPI